MTHALSPGGNRAVTKTHNPPQRGEIFREVELKPLDLTITAAPVGLRVTRKALAEVLSVRTDVSRDMAIRLAKALPQSDIRVWLSSSFPCLAGNTVRAASVT
jgi:addiction module HigA family antidote